MLQKTDVIITTGSPKILHDHQRAAHRHIMEGFAKTSRGLLVMPCGTGKTLTAIRVAEDMAGNGGPILVLVPSITLLVQQIREWQREARRPLHLVAVCGTRLDLDSPGNPVRVTNNPEQLSRIIAEIPDGTLPVILSTYHSLGVVGEAQHSHGLPSMELVIGDEAHRTTGGDRHDREGKLFCLVHDEERIRAHHRLFMTATPRPYQQKTALLGPRFFSLSFEEAVTRKILSDYQVIIPVVGEETIARLMPERPDMSDRKLSLDETCRMVGGGLAMDRIGAQRGMAFWRTIASSERMATTMEFLVPDVRARHFDARNSTRKKLQVRLDWVREDFPKGEIRLLSNARCLTEGVDIPSLDAVLFMNPKKSEIDILQAVGRVMRRNAGKARGSIILPVALPGQGHLDSHAVNREFTLIWQVFNAIRDHDDRFEADLVTDDGGHFISDRITLLDFRDGHSTSFRPGTHPLAGELVGLGNSIARRVRKRWRRDLSWPDNIAARVRTLRQRIEARIVVTGSEEEKLFNRMMDGLRLDVNPALSDRKGVTIILQSILTDPLVKPFEEEREEGPLATLTSLLIASFEGELAGLEDFYASHRRQARSISVPAIRQEYTNDLYDRFFRQAFPKSAQQLGIVYTPLPVVDFILRSIDDLLRCHRQQHLGSSELEILDPFTGIGTFPVQLVRSGFIPSGSASADLARRLHANELVVLAGRMAVGSTSEALSEAAGRKIKWQGLCLGDTFAMNRPTDLFSSLEGDSPRQRQESLVMDVIMGNPPWSMSQRFEDDACPNGHYPWLDDRIRSTFAGPSGHNRVPLYDSYVRAIRWSLDRLGPRGIIGFVVNNGFLRGKSLVGLRRALVEECRAVHIVDMRGDIRQNIYTDWQTGEGENLFGRKTMTGVALLFLVRKGPEDRGSPAKLHYHAIGDDLTTRQKLDFLVESGSISSLDWQELHPDGACNWFGHDDESFRDFRQVAPTRASWNEPAWFAGNHEGLMPTSETWCVNASRKLAGEHLNLLIQTFNEEVDRYAALDGDPMTLAGLENFVRKDPGRIKWSRKLVRQIRRKQQIDPGKTKTRQVLHHPFVKRWLAINPELDFYRGLNGDVFPDKGRENRMIITFSSSNDLPFSTLMVDTLPICSSQGGISTYLPLRDHSTPPPHRRS